MAGPTGIWMPIFLTNLTTALHFAVKCSITRHLCVVSHSVASTSSAFTVKWENRSVELLWALRGRVCCEPRPSLSQASHYCHQMTRMQEILLFEETVSAGQRDPLLVFKWMSHMLVSHVAWQRLLILFHKLQGNTFYWAELMVLYCNFLFFIFFFYIFYFIFSWNNPV